jgi:ATP-dependent protease ClpP protease subunit
MKGNATKYRFEQKADSNAHKLYIYDTVTAYGDFNWETWDYDESETSANFFRQSLEEIPETDQIELHINSYGGDVKEGIAIYNMLKQHKAGKICYVDGFAYSIASVIALACDKIIMGLGTSMLIHNMSMSVYGNAETLRKCADDLDVLMQSNRQIYLARAKNLTEEQLIEMMDKETYLTPEQCLEYGFCDEIATTYSADQNKINQLAGIVIQQLRQELNNRKSFMEEMKKFVPAEPTPSEPTPVQAATPPAEPKEPENNTGEKKMLNMMNAFYTAFQKKED